MFGKKHYDTKNKVHYYSIPSGFPLFKATKHAPRGDVLHLRPDGFYFFGLKHNSPDYIESYEDEYGIIYEFVTTREYQFIALDDMETKAALYLHSHGNTRIQHILQENYGYMNENVRDSVSEPDRALSKYLCESYLPSIRKYDGYAIHDMTTHFGGRFHDELMICKMDGIEFVGRVTTDRRMQSIIERARLEEHAKQMKESRKKPRNRYVEEDSPARRPRSPAARNIGFQMYASPSRRRTPSPSRRRTPSPSRRLFGGKRTRKYKI